MDLIMSICKLPEFSPEANILWDAMTTEAKTEIISFVYCGVCRTTVSVVNFKGSVHNGYLYLEGYCAVCGDEVAKLLN